MSELGNIRVRVEQGRAPAIAKLLPPAQPSTQSEPCGKLGGPAMASTLTLHPTAAAAAQALSEGEGGPLVAGDSARGFFAFALEMARKARPFRLPDPAERLGLAWAAAQRARL